MTLNGSPVQIPVDSFVSPCKTPTGNIAPLLHEIKHALTRWLNCGEIYAIDLRGIPMAPGEEEELLGILGEGELNAQLSLTGKSSVIETRFPAVWLVTHYNADDTIIGRFVEVCEAPDILMSQTEDARDGLEKLESLLQPDTQHDSDRSLQ